MQREDNRGALELRPMNFQFLEKGKANARCLYESKNTKIICALYGPSHGRQQKTNPDCELKIDLNLHNNAQYRKQNQQQQSSQETPEQKEFEKYILQLRFQLIEVLKSVICLQEYQKTNITIIFDILESDGDLFVPLVNLLNYSLNLSGLKLVNQFSAGQALYFYENEQICLDPTEIELQQKDKFISLQLVTTGTTQKIIYFKLSNEIKSKTIYEKLFSIVLNTTESVSKFSADAIEKFFTQIQEQQ